MNSILVVLSLAVAALARPQAPLGPLDARFTKITKITTEGTAAAPAWLHEGSDAKLTATGRSLWGAETTGTKLTVGTPATATATWSADARAGGGRSAWEADGAVHAVHLAKDAHPVVEILQQEFENPAPGSYVYSYKTANGIEAKEQAALKADDAEAVQGVYSWVAPDGQKFAVEYVADETGFHARGAHIPEIPLAIARSLEWNAAHPEEEKEDQRAEAAYAASGRASAWKSAGRSAWVSESSAALPAWEAAAKVETASTASARTALPAWETHATLPAGKVTKITETHTTSGLGSGSGLLATNTGLLASGRSAWTSDHSGLEGLGATKITKITETRTLGTPSTLTVAQPAWAHS